MTSTIYPLTVRLPAGVRHYQTSGVAETWEAWDALTAEGWTERSWWVDADQKQCPATTPGARLHVQKRATLDGYNLLIFPPTKPRETS